MKPISDLQAPYLSIKNWCTDDRPREKFLNKGRQSLSDAELIALLLGTGYGKQNALDLGRQLLAHFQGDLDQLGLASIPELTRIKGIGPAKAVSLAAALELGRRRKAGHPDKPLIIRTSRDIWEAYQHLFEDLQHEEFRIALLNRANRVIHQTLIGVGGVTATVADPKKILRSMLDHQASGLILMHNHPSGQKFASPQDKGLTARIQSACNWLDVSLLDHVIFVPNDYFSFSDEHLL
jgi:DNA repair protein RadC